MNWGEFRVIDAEQEQRHADAVRHAQAAATADWRQEADRFRAKLTLERLRYKYIYRHQHGIMQVLGNFGRQYFGWLVAYRWNRHL